jgi:hypothetical protein
MSQPAWRSQTVTRLRQKVEAAIFLHIQFFCVLPAVRYCLFRKKAHEDLIVVTVLSGGGE